MGYKAFQQIKQNFENLTQNFACQNPSSFLASSASLGKTNIVTCSKVPRGGIGCGLNISWDLVDLSNLLFLCSAPINGSMVAMALTNQGRDEATIIPRNVSRRPPMACHPEKHQVVTFMDVTHIKYHWKTISYIHDILMFHWIFIRSGEKLHGINLFGLIFADVRDLPWIFRISTAREEKHRPRPGHRDLFGTRWNQVRPALSTWICLENYG